MKIALLIATALLISAPAAMAQTTRHTESSASATTRRPDGTTITQSSRVVTDIPMTVLARKPATAASKAHAAPAKKPPAAPSKAHSAPAKKQPAAPAKKAQPAPSKKPAAFVPPANPPPTKQLATLVSQTDPPSAKPRVASNLPAYKKWEPLVVGMKDNFDIAKHIDDSLAIDPHGNRPLTPALCQPNGYSCGTPAMLLRLAIKADPDKKDQLTLKNFSGFVRRLVLIQNTDPPGSERWMGAIKRNTRQEYWNAMSRTYDPDEKVYADPDNMKPIVQSKCVNFIGDLIPEHGCAYVYFMLHETDENHVGPEADNLKYADDDVCRPAIKGPGDNEFRNALIFDQCPRIVCPNLGKWFSFEAEKTGVYILRLPKSVAYSDVVLDFCVLFADGTQTVPTRITKTAYASFWRAYIDFPPDFSLSKESREQIKWRGLVHTWQMSNRRAYPGPRPPPDSAQQ